MFDVIIPAAGSSVRVGFDKLNELIGEITVLQRTVNAFSGINGIDKIIVVGKNDVYGAVSVEGGRTRSESVKNALKEVTAPYVLIHDGARPFVGEALIKRVMEATAKYGSAIPVIPLTDTVAAIAGEYIVKTVPRAEHAAIQTPQGFSSAKLGRAFELAETAKNAVFTDESGLYAEFVEPCKTVPGDPTNKKITYASDFFGINARTGCGFDLHVFTENKPLRLCGTDIPYEYGLLAHSDGDAPLHALMDALLTAAGERDIGVIFPDSDPAYKDIDSVLLLKRVTEILARKNLSVTSVGIVIIAQKPKLSPYIEKMRKNLSAFLNISPERVGISATTTEGTGIVGESKAIAAIASAVLI